MTPLVELLGESPGIVAVREKIGRLLERHSEARRLPPILIQGETGTGKGLLAREIHRAGPRAAGPFVDVNCAAIPETLLEAELFGFERGAFTDARQAKAGLFQVAHRGTLFLDEVGLLPEGLQAKLLTAIEERVVRRLGSTRSEPVDAWILTATSEDLTTAMRTRRFREDLYHRLAVLTLWLPPLRERGRDILLLAEHFLARACADYDLPPKTLAPDAREALLAYRWPGNIRELSNVMERVALLTEAPLVTAEMLGLPEASPAQPHEATRGEEVIPLEDAVASVERAHLLEALRQTNWNISRAAARLGIPRNTLRYRIEKHGLRPGALPPPSRRRAERAEAPAPAVPAAVPGAVPASIGIRWERRRLTLLRAALVVPPATDAPLDTSRALEVLMEKVQSFGGRVEELSPLGLVAAFGIEPVEDAPRRAAHAAMAIQKAAERARRSNGEPLAVKVSIHVADLLLGEVIGAVKVDLEAKRQALMVLEMLLAGAEPDSILVSTAAASFLDRRFDLAPVRQPEAAGYRLQGSERVGLEFGGLMTKFVGRDQELALLRSRLRSAVTGQGELVGIGGEPGIGKSRLLHEFRRTLKGEQATYLEGHCLSYGTAIPYLPVLDILRANCGISEIDSDTAVTEKVHAALEAVGMDPGKGGPFLLHLLGIRDGTGQVAALGPDEIKARIFEILRQMSLSTSRHRPLVIAVEDLHWIDKASEEYFASLAETIPSVPILLVFTYRSGYPPPWIEKSYATQIALPPLAPEDSERIVRSVLGTDQVANSQIEVLLSKAEGNPFFLEELARTVHEHGGLAPTLAVPDTIQEALRARIDRLPLEQKLLLESAAVIGKNVPLVLLKATAELPEPELRRRLGDLQASEFLYTGTLFPGLEYTFKHALTQEVAYRGLPDGRKKDLHRKVLKSMERLYKDRLTEHTETLAYHAVQAEIWDKAVDYLREASAGAASTGVLAEALEKAEQALELLSRLPVSPENMRRAIDVRLDLHAALLMLGQIPRLVQLTEEAERLARQLNDAPRLARVFYRLGNYRSFSAQYGSAIDYQQRARDIGRTTDDPEIRILTALHLGSNYAALGNYRQAVDLFTSIVEGADAEFSKRRLGATAPPYVLGNIWLGLSLALIGDFERALAYIQQAVQAADEADSPVAQTAAWILRGTALGIRGDFVKALPDCERAMRLCETKGIFTWLPAAYSTWGWVLSWSGRAGEATSYLERSVQFHETLGISVFLSTFYVRWAEALLLAGRLPEAKAAGDRVLELTVRFGERGIEAEGLHVLGEIALASDPTELDSACTFYERAKALADELGLRPLAGRCHLGLGKLHGRTGKHHEAEEHLTIATTMFREMDMRFWLEKVEAERKELARRFQS